MFNIEEGKETNVSSLEQILMKRLDKAFEALDIGQGDLFDDVVEEIEMLLKLKPSIFNQLLEYKEKLTQSVAILAERAGQLADTARNQIQRRAFYESEVESIEWDARKDYLDQIITLMGINQMIPMEIAEPATLEQVGKRVEETKQEEIKKDIVINEKKPRLSFKPKKVEKDFEI